MARSRLNEKFTARSKRVLTLALEEAKTLSAPNIDSEHLLLALLRDEGGTAAKILETFKIDFHRVKEMVQASVDYGEVEVDLDYPEAAFSESAQEALATAALQAYLWGANHVGTEHILCGLSKTSSGLACHILRSFGITYERIKSKVETDYSYPKSLKTENKEAPATPLLNSYGRDLTELARENLLDPVVGREMEIARCLQILSRRTKNNPVLLGEAGVGKTAIVEGLAQRIVKREVPQKFFDTRLISLDLSAVVAGTRFRGDFEERLMGIIAEAKEANYSLIEGNKITSVILFIDEIHNVVGAGGAGGALDAANILKPALARGELRCIGATTADEYAQFIEDDTALERRFQPILVDEPSVEVAVQILRELKPRYEQFHRVKVKPSALKEAVQMAKRYLPERNLPDSAIDILDEASSKKAVNLDKPLPQILTIEKQLATLREKKELLVRQEKYEEALKIRADEVGLETKLTEVITRAKNDDQRVVDEKDMAEVVSEMTGIPIREITQNEAEKLLELEKELGNYVIGQTEALKALAASLRRSRVGLTDPHRPQGSFIFLGTTGVGKTLVATTLAKVLFDDAEAVIRLDMSEFSERHTVSRLVGAPPGYIGFEEGGELTEKLRRRPYSVILLDEIEKAHPDIFNTLLQILEDGHLTDGRGREVNFKNAIIIMTSNVGTEYLKSIANLGFKSEIDLEEKGFTGMNYADVKAALLEELKKSFKPEFLNRVDSVVVFKPLTRDEVKSIAKLQVGQLSHRAKEQKITLKIDNEVWDFLVERGFSPEHGAREMRRVIQETIEEPLSEGILSGRWPKGSKVTLSVKDKQIILK